MNKDKTKQNLTIILIVALIAAITVVLWFLWLGNQDGEPSNLNQAETSSTFERSSPTTPTTPATPIPSAVVSNQQSNVINVSAVEYQNIARNTLSLAALIQQYQRGNIPHSTAQELLINNNPDKELLLNYLKSSTSRDILYTNQIDIIQENPLVVQQYDIYSGTSRLQPYTSITYYELTEGCKLSTQESCFITNIGLTEDRIDSYPTNFTNGADYLTEMPVDSTPIGFEVEDSIFTPGLRIDLYNDDWQSELIDSDSHLALLIYISNLLLQQNAQAAFMYNLSQSEDDYTFTLETTLPTGQDLTQVYNLTCQGKRCQAK